jgi:hypothetical protein
MAVSASLPVVCALLTSTRNYYMLGKCLWKMWTRSHDELSEPSRRPMYEEALESFSRAIKKLPGRDSRKEPILEPHYKLVSVVHKLVIAETLEVFLVFAR